MENNANHLIDQNQKPSSDEAESSSLTLGDTQEKVSGNRAKNDDNIMSLSHKPMLQSQVSDERNLAEDDVAKESLAELTGLDGNRADFLSAVFSTYLCRKRSFRSGGYPNLLRVIHGLATTSIPNRDDIDGPSVWPKPIPNGVLEARGIGGEKLVELWSDAKGRGEVPKLPDSVIVELIAPCYWQAASQLLDEGPGACALRVEAFLASEVNRPTANGPGDFPSQPYLDQTKNHCALLLRVIVELAQKLDLSTAREMRGQWTSVPKIDVPQSRSTYRKDGTAPPVRLVRQALAGLDEEIERKLGVPTDEQLKRLEELDPERIRSLGVFRALRDRVTLGLLATVGMRVGALVRLNMEDVVHKHRCPDGSIRPSIALRPQKTLSDHEVRQKPIPEGLALQIAIYQAFVARTIPGGLVPGNPLLVSSTKDSSRRLSETTVGIRIGGVKNGGWRPGLLRRGPESGYAPHTLRACCAQICTSLAAAKWIDGNRGLLDPRAEITTSRLQSMIADSLIDHEISLDSMGYFGGKKEEDRERLSMYGTQITWAILTTDIGARKVPDEESFRGVVRQLAVLESEEGRIKGERTKLQQAAMAGQTRDSGRDVLLLSSLTTELEEIREQVRELESEKEDLKLNPDRLIAVDDSLEELPEVDLEAIEREMVGGETKAARRSAASTVRDWITPAEFAEILGVGNATVRRWLAGSLPRGSAPWSPSLSPIDDSLGARRRRLSVARINASYFDTPEKLDRLNEIQAQYPKGWSRAQNEAPLVLGNQGAEI